MKTDKKIIKMRKQQPLLTGSEMGRILNVSRQYVSRILKEADLHNIQPTYKRVTVQCKVCGKTTPRGQQICPLGECREQYYNIDVTCSFCKYSFRIKRGHIIQRHKRGLKNIYCSHECYAKGKRDGIS